MIDAYINQDGTETRTYAAWADAGNDSIGFYRPSTINAPTATDIFMFEEGEFAVIDQKNVCEDDN